MKATIFIFCSIICFQNLYSQSAKDWYDSAYVAIIIQRKYERAVEFCNKAILIEPGFADAWNRRGYAKTLLAKYSDALQDLNEALRLNPSMAKGYFNRGTAYYWLENYASAIPDFEQSAALDPNLVTLDWSERYAYALYRQSQFAKSISVWDKAIGFNPGNAFNWLNRALCKYSLQQYDASLPDFNEAIKLKPDFGLSYVYRGEVYKFKKMYPEGEADFVKAVNYFPDDIQNWLGLMECRYNSGKYKEALEAIDRFIKLEPKNGYVWNLQGLCRLNLKDYQKATSSFTEAMNADPKEPRYPNNRGYAFFMLGQYQKAIDDYDRGAALLPPKTDPFYRYKEDAVMRLASAAGAGETEKYQAATYLLSAKKYPDAVSMFTTLIGMNASDARYYFGRYKAKYGGIIDLENRWKDAAKSMELDPLKPDHFYWLGYEYYLMKKDEYAIKCFDEAMRLGGGNLPSQNPGIIGNGNYKQVILNKQEGGSTVQNPTPAISGGKTLTPQEIDRFLQMTRDEMINQLPVGSIVVEKGVFGYGGRIMKYKLGYNQAYQLIMFYPESTSTKVICSSIDKMTCDNGGVQGFKRQSCTQQNDDWYTQQTQEKTFQVMVNGQGPVYYALVQINSN